jgi:hypothetical protein
MPEAWMVRDMERNNALESMKRDVLDLEAKLGREQVHVPLVMLIITQLCAELHNGRGVEEVLSGVDYHRASGPYRLFYSKILTAATSFSKNPEEQNILLCRLLKFAVESFTFRFQTDLHQAEFNQPHRFYDGHGPMDEVEMPLPHQVG